MSQARFRPGLRRSVRRLLSPVLPEGRRLGVWPPVGRVRFGSLRRTSPLDPHYGFVRGQPIDRPYIEEMLAELCSELGVDFPPRVERVLEFGEPRYGARIAGATVEVLDVDSGNPQATVLGDVAGELPIPSGSFDLVICTQVLQLVWDVPAALGNLYRVLKPGGVLLVTVPAIAKRETSWEDYWRFSRRSLERMLAGTFAPGPVRVSGRGNVLAAISYLHGLAVTDLRPEELAARDPVYDIVLGGIAIRPE